MRTTVNIDERLLELAKERARQRKWTLGEVMNEALRRAFFECDEEKPRSPIRLVTYCGKGMAPGVNLDSNSELSDFMEDR